MCLNEEGEQYMHVDTKEESQHAWLYMSTHVLCGPIVATSNSIYNIDYWFQLKFTSLS